MNEPQPPPPGTHNDPATQEETPIGANPGYVLGQLNHAIVTSQTHNDPATQERARAKIDRWMQVLHGMSNGSLTIGTRTPVTGTPAWATLEVVVGGFPTGNLLAGGDLQPHERTLIQQYAGEVEEGTERAILNQFFLSDKQGLDQLLTCLDTGTYRIAVPEEGALLVIAWLVEQNRLDEAKQLISQISPFLDKLRFYPVPAEQPIRLETLVSLKTVGQIIAELEHIQVPNKILVQRETILVWLPIYDQIIGLFGETVEGMAPYVPQELGDGRPLRHENGQYQIAGGWPCQHYPPDWNERAGALLEDYRALRSSYRRSKGFHTARNFAALRDYLERCVADPKLLSGYEVGCIRSALAEFAFRRGAPGSERHQQLRQHQQQVTETPTTRDLARILIGRLLPFPAERGLPAIGTLAVPVRIDEQKQFGVPAGTNLPAKLVDKLERCLEATLAHLVQHNIIPSSEAIADVLPPLTANVQVAGFSDVRLRWLYSALYTAFRRRRSLMLFNLQHQVRFNEVPWATVLEAERTATRSIQQAGIALLSEVITLTLTKYPQQILPNRLLREIRSLAQTAGLQLPIVDELATDIFMGTFSEKFLRAAQQAAPLLAGSLYERYYGLDYQRILAIDDVEASRYGAPTSEEFARYCRELARATDQPARFGRPSYNGTIIEQQQILTTHNLAPLFIDLGLAERLNPRLEEMAKSCFIWICRTLQLAGDWRTMMRNMKNSAYAWRQMLFYLSLLSETQQGAWLDWAVSYLAEQKQPFRQRLQPVLDDLVFQVARCAPLSQERRPFLGWSIGRHWLLPVAES